MLETVKKLLNTHDLGVLATCADRPHTSLMSYLTDDDGRTIYFMTLKGTKKFSNLIVNPEVSFLVDTRADHPPDGNPFVKAMSINGTAEPVADRSIEEKIKGLFLERFPLLEPLIRNRSACVIALHARSILLLDGPLKSHYIELT
jgi:general stress protein 26